MKQTEAVNQFLAGRHVVIARFVAHRHKEVQNKAKKVVGIVNLYEVQCADSSTIFGGFLLPDHLLNEISAGSGI